jgi:phosphoribosyl-ATP pyrophosphohydrolase
LNELDFILQLERTLAARLERPTPDSYTARLAGQGVLKVAQKVGEEGLEVALAAAAEDPSRVRAEAADLVYHLLLLLQLRGLKFSDVVSELAARHRESENARRGA